ncbi:MAG TPA: hypothetical protein DIU00_12455 [Phycisphaerales bacterium]|nr:hypothetical protein [Phycisphaerales bacterium]
MQFSKKYSKKRQKPCFQAVKGRSFGQAEVVFFRESRPVDSEIGFIDFQVCPIPAFKIPVPGSVF